MAVLGKKKLTELIKNGILLDDYIEDNINSASYDLRIGTIYKDGMIYSMDNEVPNTTIQVNPSEIITLLTLETVKIPLDCVGTVFAINRMSSKGFLILNPGHIDPGYEGPITICAINLSNNIEPLHLKQSIFTLIINKLDKKLADGYEKNVFVKEDRKHYETKLFAKSFRNLSNSFFDLIYDHKELPEIIDKILSDRKKRWWNNLLNSLTKGSTIMRGVYAIIATLLLLNLLNIPKEKDLSEKIERVKKELQTEFEQSKAKMEKENIIQISNLKKQKDFYKKKLDSVIQASKESNNGKPTE